jgi:hypothetical protein
VVESTLIELSVGPTRVLVVVGRDPLDEDVLVVLDLVVLVVVVVVDAIVVVGVVGGGVGGGVQVFSSHPIKHCDPAQFRQFASPLNDD